MSEGFERLLFGNMPQVPAENRWLKLTPMAAWAAILCGLLGVGADAWLLAFSNHQEYAQDYPDNPQEDAFKVLRGDWKPARESLEARGSFRIRGGYEALALRWGDMRQ